MVKLFRELFDEDTHKELHRVFDEELNWSHCNVSEDGDPQKFWYCDGSAHPYIDESIPNALKEILEGAVQDRIEYIRYYCNGQSFGEDGSPHRDYAESNIYTLLYYPMLEWEKEWGGYMHIFDENDEIMFSWWPKPNSAVLFNSNLLHVGTAPFKRCVHIRYSLAIAFNTIIGEENGNDN